jgi:hypothetical protein
MQGILVALLILAAALSRPIEVRLWRAGRLSDRTATLLLLGRLPVMVFLFGLIQGYVLTFTLAATALALVVPAFIYRFALTFLREQDRGA